MNLFRLGPFLGRASYADPRAIGPGYAQDELNVRGCDGGWLEPRYGYQKLSAGTIPAGFATSYRMDYLAGYDSSYVFQEEYPLVETISGNTYPYLANPTTGARTENKNGAAHLALTTSDWRWFAYNGYGYGVNKSATYPIIRYTMGTTNTIANITVPVDPTTAETYVVPLPNATTYPTNPANYKTLSWAGVVPGTDIVRTGVVQTGLTGKTTVSATATTITQSGAQYLINELASTTEPFTITITSGTGSGTNKYPILSNTGTVLTVASWANGTPDATSVFTINLATPMATVTGGLIISNMQSSLNSSLGSGLFTLDFNTISGLGIQDFTNNDTFQLEIYPADRGTGYTSVDPNSWVVTLTSQAGVVYTGVVVRDSYNLAGSFDAINRTTPHTILTISFPGTAAAKPSRAAWATIQKITVSYNVIGEGVGYRGNRLIVRPLLVGGVNNVPVSPKPSSLIAATSRLSFGYSYYSSTTLFESGIGGIITVPFAYDLQGLGTLNAPTRLMGSNLTLKATVSADSTVSSVYFYVQDDSGTWRKIGSANNSGTPSVTYALTWTEVLALTAYSGSSGTFPYTGIKRGIPLKGWVLWLVKGGNANLKHSGVGNPLRLYNATTDASSADQTRPANFTLADNFGDEPLNAFACDDSIIITGGQGIYAQVAGSLAFAQDSGVVEFGHSPATMTPPKRLPGTQGCAGDDAACRWHDDAGNAGVAWMSKDGEIWLSVVTSNFDGDQGHRTAHLSAGIQGWAKTFLWDQQSLTDLSGTMMGIDDATDSLWIVNKARAIVLTRRSLIDGQRQWLSRSYTGMNIKSLAFSTSRRLRAAMTTGEIIELEYDSSNTYTPLTGSTRDMGSAMPTPFWTSKIFTDGRMNKRVNAVRVQRDTTTDLTVVTVYTTKSPSGLAATLASGQARIRFPSTATGPENYFKIALDGTMGKHRDMVVEELGAAERLKA